MSIFLLIQNNLDFTPASSVQSRHHNLRSTMSSSKLIVVVGATGTQGSSVVFNFLAEPGWHVRGITRDPGSAMSLKLSAKGAEIVVADLNNAESLIRAFKGAHAIFAVTDFFTPFMDPASRLKLKSAQTINQFAFEHEYRQGMNIMDAVSTVKKLERFVWSGLSAAKKWSKGKYNHIYHYDSKAAATEYLKTTYPQTWAKTSVIMVGFYLENALRAPLVIPQKVPPLYSQQSTFWRSTRTLTNL